MGVGLVKVSNPDGYPDHELIYGWLRIQLPRLSIIKLCTSGWGVGWELAYVVIRGCAIIET